MSETKRVIDLTVRMAQRSISSEFKGTALGRLWSFINPIATIAVYALIFGVVFRGEADKGVNSGLSSFALWIGVGVIAWNFMSSGIQRGMDSLVGNSGLLTKVYFPRQVLIYSSVLALAYDFAFELGVIIVIMCIAGGPGVLLMIPAVIVITLLAMLFVIGMGLILSVASVYFRDISHLWQIFNQIWMYAPVSSSRCRCSTRSRPTWRPRGGPGEASRSRSSRSSASTPPSSSSRPTARHCTASRCRPGRCGSAAPPGPSVSLASAR